MVGLQGIKTALTEAGFSDDVWKLGNGSKAKFVALYHEKMGR